MQVINSQYDEGKQLSSQIPSLYVPDKKIKVPIVELQCVLLGRDLSCANFPRLEWLGSTGGRI